MSIRKAKISGLTIADELFLSNIFETVQGPNTVGAVNKRASLQLLVAFLQEHLEFVDSGSGGSSLPAGAVIMWSGSIASIPSGWQLCNGSNGSPDLRNKFVICATADDAGAAKTTIEGAPVQTGGSASYVVGLAFGGQEVLDSSPTGDFATTGPVARSVLGSQVVVPPFFALAYIMKL